MNTFFSGNQKIGILGGGQLGRMFLQEALNFDIHVKILDDSEHVPAAQFASQFVKGDITNFNEVYNFGITVDVITIEIENVNTDALKKLRDEGKKVYPQPEIIEMIKDKGLQKEFYLKNNIPTSNFVLINNKAELKNYIDLLPFAQKLRKGGYDGKGVIIHHEVLKEAEAFDAPCVLEKFIDFEKELSCIVARNELGEIKTFPLVEQEFNQKANLVEFLFSPAQVTSQIENRAKEIAVQIISKLEMVGILAVELFLTKSGEIFVNEIAPRPHNSGHQTIEGSYTSQFEQHLRSIIGLPLGNTELIMPSVMINLLGEEGHTGNVFYDGLKDAIKIQGVYPHLYGKKTTKPFRKMGHVTVINQSLEMAKEIANQVKEIIHVKSKS